MLCAQNGVANEPCALRYFSRVYGVVVMCPTVFLEPGVVRAYSAPTTGLLDVGRYPDGEDEVSRVSAEVFCSAGYDARSIPDVRRWKYAKLLTNLGNAVEAVCGPAARSGPLTDLLQAEGEACLRAAGITYASAREDRDRRGSLLALQPVAGETRPGGSAWQSLRRGTGETEVDYLNGEMSCSVGCTASPYPATRSSNGWPPTWHGPVPRPPLCRLKMCWPGSALNHRSAEHEIRATACAVKPRA